MRNYQEICTKIDEINLKILDLLSKKGSLLMQIKQQKDKTVYSSYDHQQEDEMIRRILEANLGPYPDTAIRKIYKEIFRASFLLQERIERAQLVVTRKLGQKDTVIRINDINIGGENPVIIAGPCAVESRKQLQTIARCVKELGIRIIRGGAYKPRTSPYSFQGLGVDALQYLKEITHEFGLVSVVEIMDTQDLELLCRYVDIIQIGSRNMYNYPLLKSVSRMEKPILLKRGFMATIEEFLYAAEYLLLGGNPNVILCERGIRTFEPWTRNTLDISAVALIKNETHLPVIVDISHAVGRRDIGIPLAKAGLAVGADGLMDEVHDDPSRALSDAGQQLNLVEFKEFLQNIK